MAAAAMLDLAGGLLATMTTTEAQAPSRLGLGRREKEPSVSPEAGDYHDRDPKRKEASASEDDAAAALKKECDSLFKEGEMLKLREVERLWRETREKAVWGALARKITQLPAVDKKKKKKKKLVRVIWPDACIDYIIKNPCMMTELSAKQMTKCSKEYRQSYATTKIINAYHQALIEQRRAFGFAYDEVEVTDEEEVAVVKN
jgi:hypothetical protein